YIPQVVSSYNEPITDAGAWIHIVDTIIAVGGERYLTIGVFSDDESTNWLPVSGGWNEVFHYYYDDVSINKIFSSNITATNNHSLNVFPNPSNDRITIKSDILIESCSIYSLHGEYLYEAKYNKDQV